MKIQKQATLINRNINGPSDKPKVSKIQKQATLLKKQLDDKPDDKKESKFNADKNIDYSDFSGSEKSIEQPKPVEKPKQPKLPPLKFKNKKKESSKRVESKKWVNKMPPTLGHNIRGDLTGLPQYDEEKFCIYSVFREKMLDKVMREEMRDVVQDAIKAETNRKERIKLKRELKSQDNLNQTHQNQLSPISMHRGFEDHKYLDFKIQKEIIKKKHMLDLMMQKKMSTRKKKIIKVYGKDMLAEMYLDLLNITEGETIPKRILSPLSGRIPKNFKRNRSKKNNWNNDSTVPQTLDKTFKLNSTSIFNSPNNKKSGRNKTRNLNKHKHSGNKTLDKSRIGTSDSKYISDAQNSTLPAASRNVPKEHKRARSTGVKLRENQNQNKGLRLKGKHTRTIMSPDPRYRGMKIQRKKIKSPVNLLKALGIYRKNNLLDEVLKMYKRAAGNYNDIQSPDNGPLMERPNPEES